MVWDAGPNGGFTTGTPWLPVKPPQLSRNVASQAGVPGSVLETYRALLAFRRSVARPARRPHPLSRPARTAPCLYQRAADAPLTCVFNLSPEAQTLAATGGAPIGPSQAASLELGRLTLGPNGFAFLAPTKAGAPVSLR